MNYLALIGWAPGDDREFFTLPELIDAFSLKHVSRSGGIFDIDKLSWMNGKYLRALSPAEFTERAWPFLERAGLPLDDRALVEALLPLEQEKVKTLADAPAAIDYLLGDVPPYSEKSVGKWLKPPGAAAYLEEISNTLEVLETWTPASIEDACRTVGARFERDKGDVTHPIRVAITGREVGPSLFDTLAALGKARLKIRFAAARERALG